MQDVHRIITNTVPVFFLIYNLNSRKIDYVSPQFYDFVENRELLEGFDSHEKLIAVIIPDDQPRLQCFFDDLVKVNKYESSIEVRAGDNFKGIEWLEINTFRPKTSIKEGKFVVGHIIDITEKKKQYGLLEEENENIENVLNMVAHDLRAPFSQVEMIAELFQKTMSSTELERFNRYLHILKDVSYRATSLLDALLNLAILKGETRKLDVSFQDLRFLIKEVVKKVDNQIKDKKLQLEYIFPDYSVDAKIDVVLFEQVLTNLLFNAVKFTPDEGKISFKVDYSTKQQIELSIEDTGIGIPEKFQKKLFQGVSKVKRRGLRGEKSTGLGLYICYQIIKIHQGTIAVKSQENKGTRFTIHLPVPEPSATYY